MKLFIFVIGLMLGVGVTYVGLPLLVKPEEKSVKKPLYWVAPMDANYRRDKPGKSPMGMDLVPVYADEAKVHKESSGSVKISPSVENNLGVRTELVKKESLNSDIDTLGYVKYDEDSILHIHPRVEGWIEKLYVKASGERVKKGEALYEIYSPTIVNAQEEFVLALKRNNQRLIEAAKSRLDSLEVPASAVKELQRTRKVKRTITFYTPKTGLLKSLEIREGFFVKPESTIMSIATLQEVWVDAEIFESQAFLLKPAMSATMKLDYLPYKEWKGVVDYIYPTVDSKTRTIRARVKVANEDELLKPGMFAKVTLHGQTEIKRVVVSREALIRTGKADRVVLALGEGNFKSVDVKVGAFDDKYVEILEGLSEGDLVVTSAQFLLDSESSKTSDFKRMSSVEKENNQNLEPKEWAKARVIKIMPESNSIKVTHSPIANWKWPAMTMNFKLADELNISMFQVGMSMDIEITKTKNNHYLISNVRMQH